MAGKNLSNMTQLTLVSPAEAAAGTPINSASVDMQGWYGVLFFGVIETADPGNFAHAAQSADDATFNDLAGTKIAPAANGNSFFLDVYRPLQRHLRCEIDRSGVDTAVGDIYALQYGHPRVRPGTHGPTIEALLRVSPDEGAP